MIINEKDRHLFQPSDEAERRLMNEEGFLLDVVLQLYQLREHRELTQEQLAELAGTKQQAISRMESPGYSGHSLAALRKVAEKLKAYVDVILVPEEKYEQYMQYRYRPGLREEPPVVAREREQMASVWKSCLVDATSLKLPTGELLPSQDKDTVRQTTSGYKKVGETTIAPTREAA